MAVISPPSCFSMSSLSRFIDASTPSSMQANLLPPSFLDTYSRSTSSLGCNALCMVISFLVLWSICLISSLVEGYSPSIYSFDKFSAREFCVELFPSSPEIFFLNFIFPLYLFDGVSLQDSQVFVGVVFSERSNLVLILSVRCRLPLFMTSRAHFSMPNSITMS